MEAGGFLLATLSKENGRKHTQTPNSLPRFLKRDHPVVWNNAQNSGAVENCGNCDLQAVSKNATNEDGCAIDQ